MSAENIIQKKFIPQEAGGMEELLARKPPSSKEKMESLLQRRQVIPSSTEKMERLLFRQSPFIKMESLLQRRRPVIPSSTEKIGKLLKVRSPLEKMERLLQMRRVVTPDIQGGLDFVGETFKKAIPKTDTGNTAAVLGRKYVPPSERARETVDGLIKKETQNAYKTVSAWMQTWWRPILYTIACSAMLYIGVALAYIFLLGGGWGILLGMLQYLGVSIVPMAIWEGVKNTGIGGISRTSITKTINILKKTERGRKFLNQKIPEGYLKSALGRLGIDTRDLRREAIFNEVASFAVNGGMQFVTGGGIAGFLISSSIGYGTRFTGEAWKRWSAHPLVQKEVGDRLPHVSRPLPPRKRNRTIQRSRDKTISIAEKLAKESDQITDIVVKSVLDGPSRISVVEDVMEEIVRIEPENSSRARRSRKTVENYPEKTEIITTVREAISNNRKFAFFGAVGLSLVGLALANDTTGLNAIISDTIAIFGTEAVSNLGILASKLS